jgi:hypothetical protein
MKCLLTGVIIVQIPVKMKSPEAAKFEAAGAFKPTLCRQSPTYTDARRATRFSACRTRITIQWRLLADGLEGKTGTKAYVPMCLTDGVLIDSTTKATLSPPAMRSIKTACFVSFENIWEYSSWYVVFKEDRNHPHENTSFLLPLINLKSQANF